MVKRKCGTCKYFKDGSIAGSGWCMHPARQELQHMVLVRKSELACRNGWDQDLWEPAEGVEPEDYEAPTIPPPRHDDSPQLPVFGATRTPSSSDPFTDRVQSIRVAPDMPQRSELPRLPVSADSMPEPPHVTAEAGAANRSEVRVARRRMMEQRQLEQRRIQENLLQEASQHLDASSAETGVDAAPPAKRRRKTDHEQGSPPEKSVPPAPVSRVAIPPDESIEFSSRNERFDLPRRRTPLPAPTLPGASDSPAKKRVKKRATMPSSGADDDWGGTTPLPVQEVRAQIQADEQALAPEPAPRSKDAAGSSGHDTVRHEATVPALPPAIVEHPTAWKPISGTPPGAASVRNRVDVLPPDALMAAVLDPIDESERLRTMPRCCATCRDFRPVGDGKRGWCANAFAFTEKRMVEADQLSCRSSIGSWWLPTDTIWLERADTTYHSRPTPLLDELLQSDSDDDDDYQLGSRQH